MSAELQAEARRLYVKGVVGYVAVARQLGVSKTTVTRWIRPDYAEISRQSSNAAKRRRTGNCEICGAVTRYNGHGRESSRLCISCAADESRIWTRASIIAAIQKWTQENGRPPAATDWLHSEDGHPANTSVYQAGGHSSSPFKYWADAIEAAGFERPGVGGRYLERPWLWKFDHQEAMRLLESGLTPAAVAHELNVAPNTIRHLAERGGTFAQKREGT